MTVLCMFLLLTRIYTTAGVPVVSPGKDIPAVVQVLDELGYLNDSPMYVSLTYQDIQYRRCPCSIPGQGHPWGGRGSRRAGVF